MKFIHIGDVHLGTSFKKASFGKSFGQKKREAIKENLAQVLRQAKIKEVDMVLIAGDFFEGDYVEYKDIQDVRYLFEQLGEIKVIIVAGNHDPLNQSSPYNLVSWPENVTILGPNLECIEFEELHTSIIGYSWNSKGPMTFNPDNLINTVARAAQPIKVVLLHGDCYQDSGYLYMDLKTLEKIPCSYIALGHIHKHVFVRPWIAYSGSLEPLDFSENYDHGFIEGHVTWSPNEHCQEGTALSDEVLIQASFVTSMVQPMVQENFNLSNYRSNLELFEAISGNLSQKSFLSHTLLRINLIGEKDSQMDLDRTTLTKRLQQWSQHTPSDIMYIEVQDKTTEAYNLEILCRDHEQDMIGYFIREMQEENDPEALRLGLSFLLKGMD
jgi:DNA repair protein SbcD/Mre11